MKSARSQVLDGTIDSPQAHQAELGAADQEDEGAAVAESLEPLAALEATCPSIDAIYSPPEDNEA